MRQLAKCKLYLVSAQEIKWTETARNRQKTEQCVSKNAWTLSKRGFLTSKRRKTYIYTCVLKRVVF